MPSAYFREHLCRALEKTPEELGFVQGLDEALAPSTAPCVFLAAAYTDAEREFTTQLKAHLQARGVTVLSSRTLRRQGGQNQRKALQEAIRAAQVLLLIASPQACSSRHVQHSLQIARIYQSQICALWIAGERLQECVPKDHGEFFATLDVREQLDLQVFEGIVSTLEEVLNASRETAEIKASTSESTELLPEPRNPYKGLEAFHGDDRGDFFGRDRFIDELLQNLSASLAADGTSPPSARMLAIIGPSGSGKSSVVMAGLLPRLQTGGLPGSEHWVYLDPITPGNHPVESLALAFAQRVPDRSLKTIREDLSDDSTSGVHLLACLLSKLEEERVVLFIDQFEEVFTQRTSEEERQHFLDLLVTAVSEPQGPVIVILTLRADFYDRPMQYPELFHLIEAHHSFVLPMTLKELRDVIEKPAELPDVQLTFEDNLVSDLLFEVQEQTGALPLLQFTLDQLFQRRNDHQLTLRAYEEIGGVKGAVAKHAEMTYNRLPSEEHRKLARGLFLRLIDPGATAQDTTRRPIPHSELVLVNPKETIMLEEVTRAFISARLLTSNSKSGKATVEVSHEAVIREWTRLGEWLDAAREDVHRQQTLSEDASEWEQLGKPRDRLYRGTQLKEAQTWAKRHTPSRGEAAFLQASAAHRMRSRAGMVTACILMVLLLLFIGFQNREVFFPPDPTLVTTLADNGTGSLRWVIANAPTGSMITFDSHLSGVIRLVSGISINKNLSIRGLGIGILSVSGSGGSNVLLVESGASVTISGLAFRGIKQEQKGFSLILNEGTLTLTNISVSDNTSSNGGGGITNNGRLTINKSTISDNKNIISDNTGNDGSGGITNSNGTLTINDSTISNNTTDQSGGGITNSATLTLTNSIISNNKSSYDGGGIWNGGSLTLVNSRIISNRAVSGAGIFNGERLTLGNSTVSTNTAGSRGSGGGILNVNGGTLTLTNSTISENKAGYGGGIGNGVGDTNEAFAESMNTGGPIDLTNSTFSDNTANVEGGAILVKGDSHTTITFCTIYKNTAAGEGGGIAVVPTGQNNLSQVRIRNTLVAGNSAGTSPDIAGKLTSGGYNLFLKVSDASFIPNGQHLTDVSVDFVTDLRIDPTLRGYLTGIHALLSGSPAIDRIPLDTCHINGSSTDQLGDQRPDGKEKTCDIGAFESSS
jgi:predicted outer membrane repeat protein